MAFKMKAGKEGPMKKNFPSVFKDNHTKKVKVFGGGMNVDISTKKGQDILKEIESIPTVSSTEPGRVKNPKVTKTKFGKIFKTIGKIGGKALMGGIIDPFSSNDPRVTRSLLSKPAPKGGA